jgi:uncharacterized OB-fold protein
MSETSSSPTELFSSAAQPALNGRRCRACGYVFFPPQSYGCEDCGAPADQLESKSLRGAGTLASFATVHLHQGKDIEAPFTVGLIVLDDGPAVRAILTQRTDEGLKIGDRMHAVIVDTNSEAGRAQELRFSKEEAAR